MCLLRLTKGMMIDLNIQPFGGLPIGVPHQWRQAASLEHVVANYVSGNPEHVLSLVEGPCLGTLSLLNRIPHHLSKHIKCVRLG